MRSPGFCHVLLAWLLAVFVFSALAGCGFQPRGSVAVPAAMSVTYIRGTSPYGSLSADFAEVLRARGVKVTEVREEATAVLKIISNKIEKEVLSVNTAGRVLEYELRQTIQFSVMTADKLPLLEPQTVSMSREYLFSSSQVLSREREDLAVRHTLQQNLVNLAMLRIAAVAR
jgi:LPS-assembly lipoprotein